MTLSDDTISTLYYLPTAHGKMASLRSGTKYLLSGNDCNVKSARGKPVGVPKYRTYNNTIFCVADQS